MQVCALFPIGAHPRQVLLKHIRKFLGMQQVRNAFPLEIAAGRDAVIAVEQRADVRAKQAGQLGCIECVIFPFHPFAVRIFCTVKPSRRRRELTQNIARRLFGHSPVKRVVREAESHAVCEDQQGVVIKHFFKMGNKEPAVCGVTRKSAADVIEYAAAVKLKERFFRHGKRPAIPFERMERKQKHQVMRGRELRSRPEASVLRVKRCTEMGERPLHQCGRRFRAMAHIG